MIVRAASDGGFRVRRSGAPARWRAAQLRHLNVRASRRGRFSARNVHDRDRCDRAPATMRPRAVSVSSAAEQIASALAEDRMLVFGQPIIDLRTGEHTSNELLVRMRTAAEQAEVLAPGRFLPAAESFGLVQPIDIWMVRQATILADPAVLEVNLSAVTMCDVAARREIVEVLAAAPDAARRIVFEITETAATSHLDAAVRFAAEIERLGCRLALDDFGTGFGSFTYLRRLPVSYIKIDQSFVRGMVESLDDRRSRAEHHRNRQAVRSGDHRRRRRKSSDAGPAARAWRRLRSGLSPRPTRADGRSAPRGSSGLRSSLN